jgi:hypothetical protein
MLGDFVDSYMLACLAPDIYILYKLVYGHLGAGVETATLKC